MMEGNSQRNKRITAVVLFGFSLFYLISSFWYKMGTIRKPGPGLVPMTIGATLFVLTTLYLIQVFGARFSGTEEKSVSLEEGKNYRAIRRTIYGMLGCTVVYPFILEPLSFVLSTSAVAFFMLFIMKPQRPIFSLFLALAMAIGSFLMFSRFLGVALPSGFLEELLFRIGG
jgi:putative tricarboxylic transport membrane protein